MSRLHYLSRHHGDCLCSLLDYPKGLEYKSVRMLLLYGSCCCTFFLLSFQQRHQTTINTTVRSFCPTGQLHWEDLKNHSVFAGTHCTSVRSRKDKRIFTNDVCCSVSFPTAFEAESILIVSESLTTVGGSDGRNRRSEL